MLEHNLSSLVYMSLNLKSFLYQWNEMNRCIKSIFFGGWYARSNTYGHATCLKLLNRKPEYRMCTQDSRQPWEMPSIFIIHIGKYIITHF